jgi:predicted ATPase
LASVRTENLHMNNYTNAPRPLLRQIGLHNLLSFGPNSSALSLDKLNVLIGPNGTGKSNLIEAIALMRTSPTDVRPLIRRGGGASEWIWKGAKDESAEIELIFNYPEGKQPLRHVLAFLANKQGFKLQDERIENEEPQPNLTEPYFYYRFQNGNPVVNTTSEKRRHLARETIDPELSILAQRRDPEIYPEITYLCETYEKVRIYREWTFGRNTVFREPQLADMRNDRLEEDFSNLGLFLNRLRRMPKAKAEMLTGLRDLYEEVSDFDVSVEGGTVQVFFIEGNFTIPATRLSDGTLRYLCLLAILCDPQPPPLICIEEPELGLHPDMLPKLADYLVAASNRTQLIVTTHSDILVDSMTERPEAVVIFEKQEGETSMRRLRRDELSIWLDRYRLGQLWTKGQLGGTRW